MNKIRQRPIQQVHRYRMIIIMGYRNSKNRALWPVFASISVSRPPRSRPTTRPRGIWWGVAALVLILAHNLPAQVYKSFVDISSPASAGLKVRDIPVTGYGERSWAWYCSVVLQV